MSVTTLQHVEKIKFVSTQLDLTFVNVTMDMNVILILQKSDQAFLEGHI